jgi:hypothetical protein
MNYELHEAKKSRIFSPLPDTGHASAQLAPIF